MFDRLLAISIGDHSGNKQSIKTAVCCGAILLKHPPVVDYTVCWIVTDRREEVGVAASGEWNEWIPHAGDREIRASSVDSQQRRPCLLYTSDAADE